MENNTESIFISYEHGVSNSYAEFLIGILKDDYAINASDGNAIEPSAYVRSLIDSKRLTDSSVTIVL